MAEDEMVRKYHQLDGCESEQTMGDSKGQGSLTGCVHVVTKNRTQLSG